MKTSFLLFFTLFYATLYAQTEDVSGEENFAYQVKQVDEFIERFNNSDFSFIKQYLKNKYNIEDVSRSELIKSLFNHADTTWIKEDVVQFLADVTDNKYPPYLDFYDDNWYAELNCMGTYKGKKEGFTLILQVETVEATGGAKWVVVGVSADFLNLPQSKDYRKALNPASYGTDFMGLIDALADTANYQNYISSSAQPSQLLLFFNELYEKNLTFKQVNDITYHFLQIDNWIFQVRDFKRDTKNSGWLISSLLKVNDEQKQQYKEKILFLN